MTSDGSEPMRRKLSVLCAASLTSHHSKPAGSLSRVCSAGSSQSNLQALITLAVYLAVFIGLTWWLNESRDVTN